MNEIINSHKELFPWFLEAVNEKIECLEQGCARQVEMHELSGRRVIIETVIRLPTPEEAAHWTPTSSFSPPP